MKLENIEKRLIILSSQLIKATFIKSLSVKYEDIIVELDQIIALLETKEEFKDVRSQKKIIQIKEKIAELKLSMLKRCPNVSTGT